MKRNRSTVQRWRGLREQCIGWLGSKQSRQYARWSIVKGIFATSDKNSLLLCPIVMANSLMSSCELG